MTVVVQILFRETSLVIGDSLVSGKELDKEFFLPTIGSIYEAFPKGSGWSVTDLKKKINIIDTNLVIGWYGNFSAASNLIKELRKKSKISPLSIEDINSFFTIKNIESQVGKFVIGDTNPVGFAGSVYCNGALHNFEFFTGSTDPGIQMPLVQSGGIIKIYGSGAEDFRDYLSVRLKKIDKTICHSQDSSDTIHRLYLNISSYFLTKEILDSSTLVPSFYGGYYDFAAIFNGQLVDRKEHTYFFGDVVPDESGKPEAKLCVQGMKIAYLEQDVTLCLSYFTSQVNEDYSSHLILQASLHYFSPVDMSKSELEDLAPALKIDELDFNSEYSCHFFVIRDIDNSSSANKSIICITKGERSSAKHPVQIENQGTGLRYSWNPEFAKSIENAVSGIWKKG